MIRRRARRDMLAAAAIKVAAVSAGPAPRKDQREKHAPARRPARSPPAMPSRRYPNSVNCDRCRPDEYYDTKMKVLSEEIEHHVKEEEARMEGIFA